MLGVEKPRQHHFYSRIVQASRHFQIFQTLQNSPFVFLSIIVFFHETTKPMTDRAFFEILTFNCALKTNERTQVLIFLRDFIKPSFD
jgi:hypothetical protein